MSTQHAGKKVSELAALVGGRVAAGDGATVIERVASLALARAGEIAFVEDAQLLEHARASGASCLIVPEGAAASLLKAEGKAANASQEATQTHMSPETSQANSAHEATQTHVSHGATETNAFKCLIETARPKLAFALIAEVLHPRRMRAGEIHPAAHVAASAEIEAGAFVGAYAQVGAGARVGAGTQVLAGTYIGDGVSVGRDCVLHPHVVLYEGVTVGDRVILHASVVVGADGFGYVRDGEGVYHKFPQIGTVEIADDVEIGAHTCIDRGALGQTRIGRGTKIDNLVQVGHNVQIGARVVIAAQTGISGSTIIEDDAVIGGQVGMGDHARVESGAIVGSKAGILPGKIVRAGVWWGIPVQPLDEYKRLNAHVKRLPQMRDELKELRRQVAELQERLKEERG